MKAIDADFSETYLFPPALEDFVPSDHPARFIREFVEYTLPDIDLVWKDSNDRGRPPWSGALLLRVWLYSYMHSIKSVRKVEAACREHVGLLWLTGMRAPDHNTLWRFWVANRESIKQVFRQAMRLAFEAEMVGLVLNAVDGTKVQSRSSTREAWRRKDLEKFLARINHRIDEIEDELACYEEGSDEGYRLNDDLSNQQHLRDTIQQRLKTVKENEVEVMNPHEVDAKVMKTSAGKRLGYNGQIVVDGKNDLIIAEDLLTEAFDQGQLMPMLDQVEKEFGKTAKETVADGGYNTEETLIEAEAKNRSITVAAGAADAESNAANPYHASHFHYDDQKDVYICPQGDELVYEARKNRGGNRRVRVYRCQISATCPVAADCTSSAVGRTVERSDFSAAVERNREKRRSEQGRANLKRRMAVAERPFACMKEHLGLVRFRSAGIKNAKAEWTWTCLSYNLKILLKRWREEAASSDILHIRKLPQLSSV